MKKIGIVLILLVNMLFPQAKAEVMTLGVFHFNFPNQDVVQFGKNEQINVLEEKYQKEILQIVEAIKKFNPTKIVIERQPRMQNRIDSLYNEYTKGNHNLSKDESQQIGFRIAKDLNHPKLYCVDEWGRHYDNILTLFDDNNPEAKKFDYYYKNNPDTVYKNKSARHIFLEKGIIADLIENNNPEVIKKSLNSYLIGSFKYEDKQGDYTGVDFQTGRWFSRNLRIFRNIQRFTEKGDRILVIFGAGHLNVLNYLFEGSPEYKLISPVPYLNQIK